MKRKYGTFRHAIKKKKEGGEANVGRRQRDMYAL
jgi:hypothetical protein